MRFIIGPYQLANQHSAHNLKQGSNNKCNKWARLLLKSNRPRSCSDFRGAQRFPNSHLTYSMLQSIPICTVGQSGGRSRRMILWCKKSNFAVLYPLSYGPVAYARGITTVNGTKTNTRTGKLAKIMLFSFGTETTLCCSNILQFDKNNALIFLI